MSGARDAGAQRAKTVATPEATMRRFALALTCLTTLPAQARVALHDLGDGACFLSPLLGGRCLDAGTR